MITEATLTDHGFERQDTGSWIVWVREQQVDNRLIERCCQEPKTEPDGYAQLVCGKHSEVYRFELDGRVYYFKEFLNRGWKDWIKNKFRDSRAVRALQGELVLHAAGLHSPPIILIGKEGERNFMVTEEVPDATDLYFMVTAPENYPVPPHRFATRLGELVGTLHAHGISHGDLRWGNILWNGKNESLRFYLIDNERTVQYPKLPDKLRFRNLVQMAMSADHLSTYLVLRFYVAYLKKNPGLKLLKGEWLENISLRAEERRKRAKLRSAAK